ncbi:hypothetical protein CMO88_02310 [Candidatus Woesearchaeota archaeon]|nr:hypothetical protein [Candidatus Woesearchaeota archaeon]|tara:strand:- start:19769 stop:20197 length:429 start_codon:yes stop_codon:yes gene_type:complete
MKLVVDSNVLFTFFWKDSVFLNTVKHLSALFAPEMVLGEIKKYNQDLLTKTRLSQKEFDKKLEELVQRVEFIPLEEYQSQFREAKVLSKDFSERDKDEFLKDIDLFALALKLKCAIWSNDKLFKKQSTVPVFSTEEMINLLG